MAKVFNEEIIKILCSQKNNKIPNEIVEPNPNQPTTSRSLQRGENYVVVLSKENRKTLMHERAEKPKYPRPPIPLNFSGDESSSLMVGPTKPKNCDESPEGCQLGQMVKTDLDIQPSPPQCVCQKKENNLVSNSLHSMSQLLKHPTVSVCEFLVAHGKRARTEIVRRSPGLFGPFFDETISTFLDRLVFCIYMLFGRQLQPQEFIIDNEVDPK